MHVHELRKGWEDGRINVNQKIEKLNNMLKFTTPSLNRIHLLIKV